MNLTCQYYASTFAWYGKRGEEMNKWDNFIEEQTDHHEEYLLAGVSPIPQCPHIRSKSGGDETYDFCDLTEKMSGRIHPCLLVSDDTCDTWQEIQEEWLKEEQG